MPAADLHARLISKPRFVILGLELRELTLGHVQVMASIGCLDAQDPAELALALVVCSLPWRDAMDYLASDQFAADAQRWAEEVGEWDFFEKRGDYLDYLRAHMEIPKMVVRSRDGATDTAPASPIPGHQSLRVLLLSRLGYHADTVGDTPYLQAAWDALTLRAMEGSVEVSDLSEDELEAQVAKVEEELQRAFAPKEEACSA